MIVARTDSALPGKEPVDFIQLPPGASVYMSFQSINFRKATFSFFIKSNGPKFSAVIKLNSASLKKEQVFSITHKWKRQSISIENYDILGDMTATIIIP